MSKYAGLMFGLVVGGLSACGGVDAEEARVESATEALTLTDGLMARYAFDDGTAKDTSGKGHNGTAVGSPTFPSEHAGKALLLNGTTQSVSIPHHADLAPAKLSACAWVKPEVATWPARLLEKAGSSYWLYLVDAKVSFGVNTNSAEHEQVSNGIVRVHEWNHICATTDGSSARIYINGVLDTTFAAPGSVTATTEPLALGWKNNGAAVDRLKGYLDDVRIYNRTLSQSDVNALYATGVTAPASELAVKCSVPGDIYLNGHATGQTCPATLSLPVAGHAFVGIGNATKGYQQQEIFATGLTPVVVSFADSNWLARRNWKILIFNVRNTNLSNGKKGKLSDAEISAALTSATKTNNDWVIPYSRFLLQWQLTSFTEEATAGNVIIDGGGFPYLDTEQLLANSGHTAFQSQYDHIFFFYPAAKATDGTAYGACCGASTGGFKTQLPNTFGVYGNWQEAAGSSQIWLHEWLHSAEYHYGAYMGWATGIDGLHGGEEHGFTSDPVEAWLPWYRAFMSGKVSENGKLLGLTPMAYLESSPLQRSLLSRTLVSPAGKPSSVSATAGTAKITLSWSAASGSPLGYSVKRGTTSGGPYTRIAANVTGTSYVDTTATTGTKYRYVVVSTSRGGESANSSEVSATAK